MNPYFAVVARKRSTPFSGGGGGGTVYYRSLVVDHTKVPSVQTDFPVLVSFTDTTLKTVANGGHVVRSDGFDIGFYSDLALTTKLKWEMESYSGSAGTVVAWVKLPTLASLTDTTFYMSYGDTSITTNQSDKANTFSNAFISVYHLGNGTTLSVADSLNANNGTNTNGVTAAAGQVDGCGSFASASSQYVAVGTGAFPVTATNLTYSAWLKATTFPSPYNAVIVRTNGSIYSGFWIKSDGHPSITLGLQGGGNNLYVGFHTLVTGTWYHVVVTYNNVTGSFGYVNGAIDGSDGVVGAGLDITAIASRIGGDSSNPFYWNGQIDEVRIASATRTADWVTAEYNNQSDPATFITVGSETPA